MPVNQSFVGRVYPPTAPYRVSREKIREFARAVKDDHRAHHDEEAAKESGYDGLIASLTFLAVAGRKVQAEIFNQFDVPINISAVIGKAQMTVAQLLKLGSGSVLELDRKVGEAIDIYVNNRLVARGEVVMVDDNRLGVTMTEIVKTDRPG